MKPHRYGDFLKAIHSTAFVRASDTVTIIQDEQTGERARWIFDFRALMLQPHWLDRYAEIFWERYGAHYPFQVGAMEAAGIGLVAAIVMKSVQRGTLVNGFFIRKSRKRQGLMKRIEGTLTEDPIILVDDLLNSGGTFEKQLLVLAEVGKSVSDLCAIVAFRDASAYHALEKNGVRVESFFTLQDFGMSFLAAPRHEPLDTWQESWLFRAPDPSFHLVVHKSSPALDASRVFFGTDKGIFYALDQKTGAVLWQFTIKGHPEGKGILSSPHVHDGVVYFGAYDGAVYALDALSGTLRWKYDDADWVGSSPAVDAKRGIIFIGLEYGLFRKRGGIVALDSTSGKEIWRAIHPSLTHGSPLFISTESLVVIGSNDGMLYAYDAESGAERWRSRTDGDIKMAPAYDRKRRLVFFASLDGKLYAAGVDDGIPVYARKMEAGMYSGPVVDSDTVYVASLDKHIYAIDLDSWKDRWKFTTNGRIFSSPALFDESLWVGSNDGKVYEIDTVSGAQKSFFQASERILTKIARSQTGEMYFGTVANELYCIVKKAPLKQA